MLCCVMDVTLNHGTLLRELSNVNCKNVLELETFINSPIIIIGNELEEFKTHRNVHHFHRHRNCGEHDGPVHTDFLVCRAILVVQPQTSDS